MLRLSCSTFAIPALAAALQGQVQVSVFAHTELVVVDQRIPASTDITAGATLSWSNPQYFTSATMSVAVTSANVTFDNSVSGYIATQIAPHAVRVRLTSAAPTEITLRAAGRVSLASLLTLDVGNDGRNEFASPPWLETAVSQPYVFEQAVTVTPNGLDVVVYGSASGSFPSTSGESRCTLSFAPTGQHVTRSGAACGIGLDAWYKARPALVWYPAVREFGFEVDNLPVTQAAYLLIGVSTQNVVIPPIGCVLRTDPLLLIPVSAAQGRRRFTLPMPTGLATLDCRAQHLAATFDQFGGALWRTSQVARLQF